MTKNEIRKLAWDRMQLHPTDDAITLAQLSANETRRRIIREIQRSAKGVDAGVSKPDLWALAKLIENML